MINRFQRNESIAPRPYLKGLRVLIVGWGNIAREVALRLAPFGVLISSVRRSPWGDNTNNNGGGGGGGVGGSGNGGGGGDDGEVDAALALLVGKGVAATDMHAMLADSDAVILAWWCRLNPTRPA